jgi:hypothetical protein
MNAVALYRVYRLHILGLREYRTNRTNIEGQFSFFGFLLYVGKTKTELPELSYPPILLYPALSCHVPRSFLTNSATRAMSKRKRR